ncbi:MULTISPECIES: ADP-ribosylglycohydrolase family protein [Niastella]|uniref:ADP-ribosylglycohydrolase family protein n=1 Tax=Niastella soli TaxID=2821487 RepID=A0ABS3YVQ8_9BACT|nr:ADP-ribosylglycohydrolase family protein [Niastella soli]MBO9202021.1 ADP-ribosylglycohydrolase family protein [Niastella soli]
MAIANKLDLAKTSLLGLSIGDALGETFFGPADIIAARINDRILQEGTWFFTDDTIMAIGVYNHLSLFGMINQDALAFEFAGNYRKDNCRGYGAIAQKILRDITAGIYWKRASRDVFDGMGSAGNGAAMRSGPIGAYFYEDAARVIREATLAAEVTHAHPEGIAGGIAVALAACVCTRSRLAGVKLSADTFYDFIIYQMPSSDVRAKIQKAKTLPAGYDVRTIVSVLGNGTDLTAQDTVPFALWCAANHTDSFVEAIWKGISGLGDRDTIAAIIGSIVVMSAGLKSIPEQWLIQVEPFRTSPFYKGG